MANRISWRKTHSQVTFACHGTHLRFKSHYYVVVIHRASCSSCSANWLSSSAPERDLPPLPMPSPAQVLPEPVAGWLSAANSSDRGKIRAQSSVHSESQATEWCHQQSQETEPRPFHSWHFTDVSQLRGPLLYGIFKTRESDCLPYSQTEKRSAKVNWEPRARDQEKNDSTVYLDKREMQFCSLSAVFLDGRFCSLAPKFEQS